MSQTELDGSGSRPRIESTTRQTHHVHLLIFFAIVAALLLLLEAIGTFSPLPAAVVHGELDLSGAWRYHVGDDSSLDLAAPQLDHSEWCLVGVPDPGMALDEQTLESQPPYCPPPNLAQIRMRDAVVWLRRTVTITDAPSWSDPALFLGVVRTRGRVYWDGAFVGSARASQAPVTIDLERSQVEPGLHVLAVRVECDSEERPGIDHDYARKVALGEYANCTGVGRGGELGPAMAVLAALLTIISFVFMTLLTIELRGVRTELFWLSVFFGAVLLYAMQRLTVDPLAWYMRTLAMASASTSVLGFAFEHGRWNESFRRTVEGIFVVVWSVLVLAFTVAFFTMPPTFHLLSGRQTAVLLPLVVLAISIWWLIRGATGPIRSRLRGRHLKGLVLVIVLYGLLLAEFFSLVPSVPLLRSPLFLPLFACLVFNFILQSHTDALRSVAFYGRFIRPGLKRLLEQKGRTLFGDEKLFRGRKTVIMKIDMVDHTARTFEMPYGMRRFFLDLWYTQIDRVVADNVFLDKSLGDGSVYCFESDLPGGSCTAAFNAALEIRDRQVPAFDETFHRLIDDAVQNIDELRSPVQDFLDRYRQRSTESFWLRPTEVRIALSTGYVDEGLWGLSSQSHYDVQGCAMVLATRMEAEANNGEIVFDTAFLEELLEESPGIVDPQRLDTRRVHLKGIGEVDIHVLARAPIAEA